MWPEANQKQIAIVGAATMHLTASDSQRRMSQLAITFPNATTSPTDAVAVPIPFDHFPLLGARTKKLRIR